jgi:RNA recognition motif-containing protein
MSDASPEPAPAGGERPQFEIQDWSNAITLYASNLGRLETDSDIRSVFEPFGKVLTVSRSWQGGRNHGMKGTAFVVMAQREEGLAAIGGLHGALRDGARLIVEQSRHPYDPAYRRRFAREEDPRGARPVPRRPAREDGPERRRDAPVYEFRRDRDRERDDRPRERPRAREPDRWSRQDGDWRRRYREDE